MDAAGVLMEASRRIFESVEGMAGTGRAAGDFGIGAGGDVSRNIDIVAEKAVLDYLREVDFECVVLGEECGRVELSENPKGYVIMDAIDGSANAVHGVPFFCSSLAFATQYSLSSVTEGVVTNLTDGQAYSASRGRGAFMDGRRISVSGQNPIYRIIGVNTSGATTDLMRRMQPVFENNHTRHFGANALEMALIARGCMDMLIDLRAKIRIQDIAAGYLLVKEAGGLMLDGNLNPLDADLDYGTRISFIAAANNGILGEIMSQINGTAPGDGGQSGAG